MGLAGFLASFVDGALGMGFGPTSSSILLGTGMSTASVSAVVNIAKVATGLAAAVSHWRFGNIGRRLTLLLAGPGCLGALLGVTILANVDDDQLRPVISLLLLAIGLRILLRFSHALVRGDVIDGDERRPDIATAPTVAAAATGGVTNGLVGTWGPVVTPYLLHAGVAPRIAIGSVNTAEVAVAVVASGSLLASVGGGDLEPAKIVAMLVGGVIAAPMAAWAIRFLPARLLGIAVSGLLFLTNLQWLAGWWDLGLERWALYGLAVMACGWGAVRPRWMTRPELAAV
ncbi:MAG TPA: sulfite exporter TauE/SafE family protein [Acidimicrobiales bacterium]|nr:sulfite exporter TauE/SafE family protein [Acidimicrobiales bacterium]